MTHSLKFSFFTLLCVIPAVSSATAVFTNFGAGFAYDTSNGNIVGNDFSGDQLADADTFTPGSSTTLSTIEVALSCFQTCSSNFTVALYTNNADAPASVLESFTVSGSSLGLFGGNNAPIVLNSVLQPTLVAGTQYWLAVLAPISETVVWNLNSTGDPSDQALSTDNGATWFSPSGLTPGAYEIDGSTAAPEPGTLLLLGSGSIVLLGIKRFLL